MNKSMLERFYREFEELETIPDRLDILTEFLRLGTGYSYKKREIITDALCDSIILSLCKSVEKHGDKVKNAMEKLDKENPVLKRKILYIKTVRDKMIAHLDTPTEITKVIERHNFRQNELGRSIDEVVQSFNEIINWVLQVMGLKDYVRKLNKETNAGLTDFEIDEISEYDIFKNYLEQVRIFKQLSSIEFKELDNRLKKEIYKNDRKEYQR